MTAWPDYWLITRCCLRHLYLSFPRKKAQSIRNHFWKTAIIRVIAGKSRKCVKIRRNLSKSRLFPSFSPLLRADVNRTATGPLTCYNISRGFFSPLSVAVVRTPNQHSPEALFAFVPAVSTGIVVSDTSVPVLEEHPFVLSVFPLSLCFHFSVFRQSKPGFSGVKMPCDRFAFSRRHSCPL